MKFRRVAVLSFLLPLLSLQSCFTGIESTPKITEKDVRRQNVGITDEMEFARQFIPPSPGEWVAGRPFVVTDSRLSMLFEFEPHVNPGDTILFRGVSGAVSITGDSISVVDFSPTAVPDANLRYNVDLPVSRLIQLPSLSLPFAIDIPAVEHADSLLCGQRYYILTNLRVDSTSVPIANGRRYVPVKVTRVAPGNADFPYRVEFVDESGNSGSVVMTAGNDRSSTRNFDMLFSFTNPRDRYPAIADAVWSNIQDGRVSSGMTTDECRLALGVPRDVKKGHNGGTFFEQWTFDNGSYLIFEDGLLTNFRL